MVTIGKISPQKNYANVKNANKGTAGFSRQYFQFQGNKGIQMNPNSKKK